MVKVSIFQRRWWKSPDSLKLFYLFLSFLLFSFSSSAQVQIKGRVLEKDSKLPAIGAAVSLKPAVKGTITDSEGYFVLTTKTIPVTLSVSFVGYKTQEIDVYEADEAITIWLSADQNWLDEVVVVAYGTQKRGNITSSISSVKSETIETSPVVNLEQAIQGKMSGVQISAASGTPGGAMIVNIRGTSSISAGNDPLYVVDGIPINSTDASQRGFGGQRLSPLADLNPADIENIEVLKDASAAALYGSRATNGVILITTKRGTASKTKVRLNYYIGSQDLWKELKFLDAPQWVAAQNEAADNFNNSYNLTASDANYVPHITAATDANTNWVDEITRSGALLTKVQLGVTGGDTKTKFYFSVGYDEQEGIVKTSSYKRYSARLNLDHQLSSRITISPGISLSYVDNNRVTGDNNIYSPWMRALEARPDYPVYDKEGQYFVTNVSNPVQLIREVEQNTKNYRLLAGLKADLKITDALNYHLNLGADYTFLKELYYYPFTSLQSQGVGEAGDYRTQVVNHLVEHTLDYNRAFGKLFFTGLLGYSYQIKSTDYNNVRGRNFISTALKFVESAGSVTGGTSTESKYALQSFFGRVNLNYADRYIVEGSLRSDASSKFSKKKRTGYFPAGSVGWKISEEEFFPVDHPVSSLKIRGSVGLTGNQEGIGYYNYQNIYASGANYSDVPGLGLGSQMNNPDLTWEKTLQYGVGVDVELLKGRVNLLFDLFRKDTRDLLLTHDINGLSGFSKMTSNVGSLRNEGIEFSLLSRNLTGKLGWNTSFNISFIRNEITGLSKDADGNYISIDSGYGNRLEVGHPMGAFYLIKALGTYQSREEILKEKNGQELWDSGIRPGDMKYYDKNDDGLYNDEDREFVGNPYPKFFGSLGNSFTYKGFDLGIDLQFSYGNDVYSSWKTGNSAGNQGSSVNAILKSEWDNRWTEANSSSNTPRAISSGYASTHNTLSGTSRYISDGSYLRIKNITLGYTLPQPITRKAFIDSARFYTTVTNLYTFTHYDGFDPEVSAVPTNAAAQGIDMSTVPQLRSFIVGVNLTF